MSYCYSIFIHNFRQFTYPNCLKQSLPLKIASQTEKGFG
jgi:hypothetical protein